MKDYAKTAVEHALAALTAETEDKVKKIVEDKCVAFYLLSKCLDEDTRCFRYGHGYPASMKEDLAAIVLYAAAMLYEWDKNQSPSPLPVQ
jgi:hypothetical protein